MSLWNDKAIAETLKYLDPETRYKYEAMGRHMYGSVDYTSEEPARYESACQVDLMLRDGLKTDALTDDERRLFVDVFGHDRLNEYDSGEPTRKKVKKTKRT